MTAFLVDLLPKGYPHLQVGEEVISAFLLFDKIKIDNHQCLNAYLCLKHPELEIDWEIMETFRILRNRTCYEGKEITKEEWKEQKIRFDIYIRTFLKAVKEKIERA